MISVLIPSRNRQELLERSIAALLAKADDPSRIEILVAADPDDAETAARTDSVVMPERFGRWRIGEYYHALAQAAKGDWLVVWNDDCVMLTQGWDVTIETHEPGVLDLMSVNYGGGCFPAWPASWAKLTGISGQPNPDCWINLVGAELGKFYDVPIEVFHDAYSLTGNNRDQTYLEGQADLGVPFNPRMSPGQAAQVIRERLGV